MGFKNVAYNKNAPLERHVSPSPSRSARCSASPPSSFRFFPTAPEHSAAPILRECSMKCWGDPWQQSSSNQPPSLSSSLTHTHIHSLSHTHTHRQSLHTLRQCNRNTPRRKHSDRLPLKNTSVSRWPSGSQPASRPAARLISSSSSAPGDSRRDPHLGAPQTATSVNGQDGCS